MKKAVTLAQGPREEARQEPARGVDGRTRIRVTRLLLERGSATAAELGEELGLSPAAIRRHLDVMRADGLVSSKVRQARGQRGRGRPARTFALTEEARLTHAPHAYDDLAAAALRWINRHDGPDAVARFAAAQVAQLEERCRAAIQGARDEPLNRAEALAEALSVEGYAASATAIATGGQLCQHNCPVAHVAAEFPQLCEAETQVIGRLVGTHVQRLATIANGDGVCTTHIPKPQPRAAPQPLGAQPEPGVATGPAGRATREPAAAGKQDVASAQLSAVTQRSARNVNQPTTIVP